MLLSPRLSAQELSELAHRLALEADSGIDVRRTWQREAETVRPRLRSDFQRIRDAVQRGDSVASAIQRTGELFPPLFREIVDVGERTGTLSRVFQRLSSYYRRNVERQRSFLIAIAWPLIQLTLAIFVIGLVIWLLGMVAQRNHGQAIDILGFGLIGGKGLFIYVNFLIAIGLCIAGLAIAVRRGMFWVKPFQRAIMRVPILGDSLQKLALARLTWALHLLMNVAMDLRQVVPLVLRATGSDYYIQHTATARQLVGAGQPLHEAFAATGAFPASFLDALEVAEESGAVVESMERLSRRYEEEGEAALKVLTAFAGAAVWLLVAALIIFMIFRIAGFYVGTIQDALKG